MKKLLLPLLLFFGSANSQNISKADQITYEFLVQTGEQTGYCDHVPIFKKIFDTIKVKTLLEFGLGYSTKYFLEHCNKVISVEFITPGWTPNWLRWGLDCYKEYSNWVPVAYFSGYKGDYSWAPYKYFGTEGFFKAGNHLAQTGKSYTTVDPAYQKELETFIANLAKYNKIDVACVDPGTVLRGEIVQLLFGKVPVITSHDTTTSYVGFDPYGFSAIVVPEDYEEIRIARGKGTTVWIKKTENYAELIQVLKEYAK